MENFKLVLNLDTAVAGKLSMAILESFDISFYRNTNNKHEVRISDDLDKLKEFLTNNEISFEENKSLDSSFIIIDIKADTYLAPHHHIELRQK